MDVLCAKMCPISIRKWYKMANAKHNSIQSFEIHIKNIYQQ